MPDLDAVIQRALAPYRPFDAKREIEIRRLVQMLDANGDFTVSGALESGTATDTAGDINYLRRTTPATNAVANAVVVELYSTGTVAAGFGHAFAFQQEDAAGNAVPTARLDTPWSTATGGATTADIIVRVAVASVLTEVLRLVGASLQAEFAGSVNVASGKVYKVNGVQVVGAQQAANADTSGATLVQLETEVNELKAALRAHGLIAT